MRTSIVLGLGYGDEGKGLTTDWLAAQSSALNEKCIVARFCGGQQAGHTVVMADGKRHVFSSIGSGSFRDAHTYISRYCTFYPIGIIRELEVLQQLDITPTVFIDPLAMMTSPYDLIANILTQNGKNTVGVGVGKTMERNATPYKLYFKDLCDDGLFQARLQAIKSYYSIKMPAVMEHPSLGNMLSKFEDACAMLSDCGISALYEYELANKYDHVIFEGAQGILLDMDHGVFPHVTYAYTTSRNAMEMINRNNLPVPYIYYVSRCYATRHGDGYFAHEAAIPLNEEQGETNVENEFQGTFRKGHLSIDSLQYALLSDQAYSANANKSLIITCLDQWDDMQVIISGLKTRISPAELATKLGFSTYAESWDNVSDGMIMKSV